MRELATRLLSCDDMNHAPGLPSAREARPLTVAYLTAGAAGMYCGSCMHDNTLARGLSRLGVDIQLIPTYTPIRTDEENVSIDQVFFGGINVFLQQKVPLLRFVPRFLDRVLDSPRLIRWATLRGIDISPQSLGALTVSMLQGNSGRQRKEVARLCDWLAASVKPDLINFTNVLIAGCAPALKKRLGVPLLVTLQGDDIFLDDLLEPYRTRAFAEIAKIVESIDGFLVHSRFYADYMSEYLKIPRDKFRVTPLGIDTSDFATARAAATASRPPTIGYLARLSKEKGLHLLVDAFIELRRRPKMREARLHLAGWLGETNRAYAEEQFARLREAGLGDAFRYFGAVDRAEKLAFLDSIDVLSTPTIYRDPKGLFVLEALAAGVPVVQPDHGAFPELIAATGGGRLFPPGDALALADALQALLCDSASREQLAIQGRAAVHERFHSQATAQAVLEIYRQFARSEAIQA
jgi:glycosyltransferase involved in cell wall biosynthesis